MITRYQSHVLEARKGRGGLHYPYLNGERLKHIAPSKYARRTIGRIIKALQAEAKNQQLEQEIMSHEQN